MSKLKRAVIKEELVSLTGDFKKAIVLNQMIYWSERVKDFDKFISEEQERSKLAGIEREEKELNNGWIYKKAEELAEETLMKVNKSTMSRCLDSLVKSGWLDRRRNPNPRFGYDKTYQYRVNLVQIQKDLNKSGYPLEGYKLNLHEMQNATSELPDAISETHEMQNATSEMQNATAIPEITNIKYKTEIIKQQQKDENRVVVVREKYESLFSKKLTKEQAEELITLADENKVDVLHKIENTHAFHTKVEHCRSIVASIKRAITHGDWEITRVGKRKSKPLPKAVKEQIDQKKGSAIQKVIQYTPEQIAHAKAEIERKKALLYADDEGVREAN